MNEEIDRILIESFPTLPIVRTKGWGEMLMHVWIQSDRSLRRAENTTAY